MRSNENINKKTLATMLSFALTILVSFTMVAQSKMNPELLWKLGRVTGTGISKDGKFVLYTVTSPNAEENKMSKKYYAIPVNGGDPIITGKPDSLVNNDKISPDGKHIISSVEVKIKNVTGKDYYPQLTKSNVYIYDSLNYRHWDEYEDGKFGHVMLAPYSDGKAGEATDLMKDEPYDCPLKPFGGDEDFIWNPNSKEVV